MVVFISVRLNPDARGGDKVRAAACEAGANSIGEAMGGHDVAATLVADRDPVTHPFFEP